MKLIFKIPAIITAFLSVIFCSGCDRSRAATMEAQIAEIEKVLEASPSDQQALHALASRYWWAKNDVDRAEDLYLHLTELNPDRFDIHFEFAQILQMKGKYTDSAKHFEQFLDLYQIESKQSEYAIRAVKRYSAVKSNQPSTNYWNTTANETVNSLNMEFIRIPAGEFRMGYEKYQKDCTDEHTVALDSYWIGKYEVTAGQFDQFIQETGYKMKFAPINDYARTTHHPVAFITWEDARAFTSWLSSREGRIYRLPSEAEWEYAARGSDGRTNPWGNKKAKKEQHGNLGRLRQVPQMGKQPTLEKVGTYPEGISAFGLHDMAGNVAEWCLDYYESDFYSNSPLKNPFGPSNPTELKKVLRGGSWRDPPSNFHAVERHSWDTATPYDCFGFRIVCEVEYTDK